MTSQASQTQGGRRVRSGRARAMWRSSWTATAAGRRAADCRGAWAIARGVEAVRRTVTAALDVGLGYLTLFSFSSENWSRPPAEVEFLFGLLRMFIRRDLADLHRDGVRVRVIGERDGLPTDIAALIREAEA